MRHFGERLGLGRQIDFPPMQRHSRYFEYAFIAFCLLCILAAALISTYTDWGVTTRPK